MLVPQLAEAIKARPRDVWLAALEAAKVPCGAINNLAQAFADPQVEAREMTVAMAHPLTDGLRLVASPMKLSATPVAYRHAPPLLGQHTHELLTEAGLCNAEIDVLTAARVIA